MKICFWSPILLTAVPKYIVDSEINKNFAILINSRK